MSNNLIATLDRVAATAVLGVMLAGLPLAALSFITNTMSF